MPNQGTPYIYNLTKHQAVGNVKSFRYTESFNIADRLRPGCVKSAFFTATCYGSQANAVDEGDIITVTIWNKVTEQNQAINAKFIVQPIISSKNTFTIEAYDFASLMDVDFSLWLSANQSAFPMTMRDLAQAAATICGLTLNANSWTGYSNTVNAFYADGITCRDIFAYIAELHGGYCYVNIDGEIYMAGFWSVPDRRIAPTTELVGTEQRFAYRQDGLQYSNYDINNYDQVIVYSPDGSGTNAGRPLSGNDPLVISNNPLLIGGNSAVLDNCAVSIKVNFIDKITQYREATVKMFLHECPFYVGQIVDVTDAQGISFKIVVTERTIEDSGITLRSVGTNEPTTYKDIPQSVTNLWTNINTPTPIDRGGTGADNAADARNNLGLGGLGTIAANGGTSVSVDSAVKTEITSVSLGAGRWIIVGTLSYDPNATGFRRAYFAVGTEANPHNSEQSQSMATAAANAFVQVMAVRNLSATTTVKLMAFHNAGSALNTIGYIRAIRII